LKDKPEAWINLDETPGESRDEKTLKKAKVVSFAKARERLKRAAFRIKFPGRRYHATRQDRQSPVVTGLAASNIGTFTCVAAISGAGARAPSAYITARKLRGDSFSSWEGEGSLPERFAPGPCSEYFSGNNIFLAHQKNGVMNRRLFYLYLANIVFPWARNQVPDATIPLLLFCDKPEIHEYHVELGNLLKKHNVVLVYFPHNTSWATQPLDLLPFGQYKHIVHEIHSHLNSVKDSFSLELSQNPLESPRLYQSGAKKMV
jgi:hypothetical protein